MEWEELEKQDLWAALQDVWIRRRRNKARFVVALLGLFLFSTISLVGVRAYYVNASDEHSWGLHAERQYLQAPLQPEKTLDDADDKLALNVDSISI